MTYDGLVIRDCGLVYELGFTQDSMERKVFGDMGQQQAQLNLEPLGKALSHAGDRFGLCCESSKNQVVKFQEYLLFVLEVLVEGSCRQTEMATDFGNGRGVIASLPKNLVSCFQEG